MNVQLHFICKSRSWHQEVRPEWRNAQEILEQLNAPLGFYDFKISFQLKYTTKMKGQEHTLRRLFYLRQLF